MKKSQLLRNKNSIKIILVIGALLFSQSLLAQDWYVWKRILPCRDSRQDWFSVAKTFPGAGFDASPLDGPLDFAKAMASADVFKMGPDFRNYCCPWDVFKNYQTGAFSVGKQSSSVTPLGFVLFRTGVCCEEAFAIAGFKPGIDCRSLLLSTGGYVTIQPDGTFTTFTPTGDPPPIINHTNCWPGSTAALNPLTNKVECYCNPGLVWNATRTACVDPKELVRNTDCSGYPGSYAAWNNQNQRVECFCPVGKVWNATRTACIDSAELVRNTDCSGYPGSYAAWSQQNQRVECFCPVGKEWNETRTACVDKAVTLNCGPGSIAKLNPTTNKVECYCKPGFVWILNRSVCVDTAELIRNTDCSGYPGTYAAWDSQLERVDCVCPAGKEWNATRTACVDKTTPLNCGPGSTAKLNPTTKKVECFCNEGLVWNETKTACIDPKKPTVDDKTRMFVGTWNGLGNAKGITISIKDDYTMSFTDTRPGYERSDKGKWGLDPDRVNCIYSPINYALWFKDGKLSDPWGNFYVK